jgi:stage II sporulation protein D
MPEPWIRVKITSQQATPPHINAALYAGRVYDVRLADGKYVAINTLPIESYLTGVLSKELYADWSMAAYRAQAIAARTYALYQIETFGRTHAWDVTGTQSSQVYGGRDAETPHSRLATRQTAGLVMEGEAHHQWGVFCAYFSACNGGAEESAHAAWGDHRVSTLVNKYTGKLDAACPEFHWPTMAIPMWAVTDAVRWWGVKNKLPYLADLGSITDIAVTRSNPITGRPEIITVTDAAGHIGKLRAEEFRLALLMDPNPAIHAPPSSFFHIVARPSEILLVDGRGFGHGIGLSQWGAEKLATEGYSARYILQMYYPGNILHREW